MHRQRDHADRQRRQHDARFREHEVEQVDLDEDGRAAHDLHERARRHAQRP
jgi:hypothetical protein